MTTPPKAPRSRASWLVLAALAACGTTTEPKPPATPKKEPVAVVATPPAPDVEAPALRTGELPLVDLGEVRGEVVATLDDGAVDTLRVVFAAPDARDHDETFLPLRVLPAGPNAPVSFAEDVGSRRMELWLRRPKGATTPDRATIIGAPFNRGGAGTRLVVTLQGAGKPGDPKARAAFVEALARHVGEEAPSLFADDAAMRVRRALEPAKKTAEKSRVGVVVEGPVRGDLGDLMRATTGIGALRAALGTDRSLAAGKPETPSIAVTSVPGPKMDTHPWAQMQTKLPAKAPAEPLADLAPADGWYVRASSLGTLFRLLDEADAWGTATARLAEDVAFDADIAARYETQLGLRRSEMARRFGDRVVGEVAVVGSDPYLREGSDVTLLFRLKSETAFDASLADSLADRAKDHGAVATTKVGHEGVEIAIATTSDGAVRRHRATVNGVGIVSNSLAATKRVIAVAKGKAPPLAKEPDVLYALARDASEPSDVLALVGERFVRAMVGPAHKIAESRRQLAHAELLAPGSAAVLHGWLKGAPPATTDALVATKLLDRSELTHAGGGAITFTPGQAPRSAWGTPAFMEPLVDRPAVDKVTPSERAAYDRFRRAYEDGWSGEPFDPIALRLALPEKGPLAAHVRVLPIPRDRDIDDLMRVVGDAHVAVEPSSAGARLVVALAPDDRWRRDLGLDLGRLLGGERRVLDWAGEWAAIGVADRNGLLVAARHEVAPELPPGAGDPKQRDEIELLAQMPLWVGVEVRSPATLGILLTVVRKLADEAVPGMVRWGEIGKEGAVPIIGIRVAPEAAFGREGSEDVNVYYAIVPPSKGVKTALYVSLREELLRGLVKDHVEGRGPRTPTAAADPRAAQALVDVAAARGGPIATLLSWIAEKASREQQSGSRGYAEWFLRAGVPGHEAELARAYLGAAPTTPSGKAYAWGPGGVTDPDRGSQAQPRYPAVPVAGTPMAAIVEALARARVATSFDEEPLSTKQAPLRSFTARVTIDKR